MAAKTDEWSDMFETFVTITVATDMMGHVRVAGTNAMTDAPPVVVEIVVGPDDTDEQVAAALADVYMRTSLD